MKKELTIAYDLIAGRDALSEIEKSLFDAAQKVRQEAYAPYSNFLVGCAVLLENGEIITGSNQENAAYPSGLCAERTAIFWTSANFPHQKIKKIFVIGAPKSNAHAPATPPCGACRQSLIEYETKQGEVIELYFSAVEGDIYKVQAVRDLLPFTFDASFL